MLFHSFCYYVPLQISDTTDINPPPLDPGVQIPGVQILSCRARRQSIVHNILIMRHFMCCVEQSCTPGKCQTERVAHRENAVTCS